jgi:hypothetical protein
MGAPRWKHLQLHIAPPKAAGFDRHARKRLKAGAKNGERRRAGAARPVSRAWQRDHLGKITIAAGRAQLPYVISADVLRQDGREDQFRRQTVRSGDFSTARCIKQRDRGDVRSDAVTLGDRKREHPPVRRPGRIGPGRQGGVADRGGRTARRAAVKAEVMHAAQPGCGRHVAPAFIHSRDFHIRALISQRRVEQRLRPVRREARPAHLARSDLRRLHRMEPGQRQDECAKREPDGGQETTGPPKYWNVPLAVIISSSRFGFPPPTQRSSAVDRSYIIARRSHQRQKSVASQPCIYKCIKIFELLLWSKNPGGSLHRGFFVRR